MWAPTPPHESKGENTGCAGWRKGDSTVCLQSGGLNRVCVYVSVQTSVHHVHACACVGVCHVHTRVRVCACMCICATCARVCMYVLVCTAYMCVPVCVCIHECLCVRVCMPRCLCTCVPVCISMCEHVTCLYVCVCTCASMCLRKHYRLYSGHQETLDRMRRMIKPGVGLFPAPEWSLPKRCLISQGATSSYLKQKQENPDTGVFLKKKKIALSFHLRPSLQVSTGN